MKKAIALIIVLVLSSTACSGHKASKEAIADAKAMLVDMTALIKKTSVILKNVKDASAAGQALVDYAGFLKQLRVKGLALQKKYPDFKGAVSDPAIKKASAALQKELNVFGKILSDLEKKYGDKKPFKKGKATMEKLLKAKKK